MYTTMESQGIEEGFQASDFKAPMAGFGYGLPLSRLVRALCFKSTPDLRQCSLYSTLATLGATFA
jgi:hypothetical protein